MREREIEKGKEIARERMRKEGKKEKEKVRKREINIERG